MADDADRLKGSRKLRATERSVVRNRLVYLGHVLGLVMPGVALPVHDAHQVEPASLADWDCEELKLMVEEGRRQADRQTGDFDRLGVRAQWLFSLGTVLVIALAGRFAMHPERGLHLVLWLVGLTLLTLGIGGAAALMATRADFMQIDTAVFSAKEGPRLLKLAESYSRMLRTGENTIATRLTVYREAVVYVIAGGYVSLIAYLVSR